ncbi:unnamed protein product [Bursaphelenchus okinawaensis]|uniref:Letm1 RBD domain-containing protein n=1 Tax=Bursaphelenchus okinawaensis TaxID=465554 RepID=A0A811JSK8_9BILA|nr:unnamed protein product [Bursaphelenchus okinawaensis]CAG9080935.1 unnamed protein product [Bursaphelenchus okinawaensis]
MLSSSLGRIALRPRPLQYCQSCQASGIYQKYEQFLEKRYPKVYRIHRLVVDGCRDCLADVKLLYRLNKDLKYGKRELTDMNTKELMCLLQTQEELPKLVTITILAPLPFTLYGLALSIIFFPRFVLTRHFWTDQQKEKFWQMMYKYTFLPRIRRLQNLNQNMSLTEPKNVKLVDLSVSHLLNLCKLHRSMPLYGCRGLEQRAKILSQLDYVVDKELDGMEKLELRNHMFLRRLDFHQKSEEEMRSDLQNWIAESKKIQSNPGLLLHLPVLLTEKKDR